MDIGRTDLDVFSKTGRVIVSCGFGIPKSFEDGIGCEDLSFDLTRVIKRKLGFRLGISIGRVNGGKIAHDEFGL